MTTTTVGVAGSDTYSEAANRGESLNRERAASEGLALGVVDEGVGTLNLDEQAVGPARSENQVKLARRIKLVKRSGQPEAKTIRVAEDEPFFWDEGEPKWMDACNRKQAVDDALINLFIGPHHRRHGQFNPEEDKKRNERFFKKDDARRNKTLAAQLTAGNYRQKRSMMIGKGPPPMGLKSSAAEGHSSNEILDKSIYAYIKPTNKWPTKKTTFSMYNKHLKHHKAVSRFLYSSATFNNIASEVATSTTSTTPSPSEPNFEMDDKTKRAIEAIFASDIKLSWLLTGALNTLNGVRKTANKVLDRIKSDLETDNSAIREQRIAEIRSQRSWLPGLDLVPINMTDVAPNRTVSFYVTGGLYDNRTRSQLVNLTHILEFYQIAFEQMKIDHRGRGDADDYKELEKAGLRMLCDCETIVSLLRSNDGQRKMLERLNPEEAKILAKFEEHYEKFTAIKSKREYKYANSTIKSPLAGAVEQAKNLIDQIKDSEGYPEHAWRDIMPAEQKRLKTRKERAYRDLSVLEDFFKLLQVYEALMRLNYL